MTRGNSGDTEPANCPSDDVEREVRTFDGAAAALLQKASMSSNDLVKRGGGTTDKVKAPSPVWAPSGT